MYLYSQIVKGDCNLGTWVEHALDLVKSHGVDTQTDYEPNQFNLDCSTLPTSAQKANAAHFKINGYSQTDLSKGAKQAIESVLAGGTPAILTIEVYPEFDNATASNFLVGPPVSGDALSGGHAVTAFAYDQNGVWILNSWGSEWGRGGWAELSWDFVDGGFGGLNNVGDVAAISGVDFQCTDSNAECGYWAFTAQCPENPNYMLTDCCSSCANPNPNLTSSAEWFRIQNVALGSSFSLDTGVIAASGNYSGQYWELTPLGGGSYRLTNMFQGVGMSFDTTQMAATGNYSGQYWTLTPVTNGVYRLTNEFRGPGESLAVDQQSQAILSAATAEDESQYWEISSQ